MYEFLLILLGFLIGAIAMGFFVLFVIAKDVKRNL